VNVAVNQPWHQYRSTQIKDLVSTGRDRSLGHFAHLPVFYHHAAVGMKLTQFWIENSSVLENRSSTHVSLLLLFGNRPAATADIKRAKARYWAWRRLSTVPMTILIRTCRTAGGTV
jgi:hypothetical protein